MLSSGVTIVNDYNDDDNNNNNNINNIIIIKTLIIGTISQQKKTVAALQGYTVETHKLHTYRHKIAQKETKMRPDIMGCIKLSLQLCRNGREIVGNS